jgi:hypothetical protein
MKRTDCEGKKCDGMGGKFTCGRFLFFTQIVVREQFGEAKTYLSYTGCPLKQNVLNKIRVCVFVFRLIGVI